MTEIIKPKFKGPKKSPWQIGQKKVQKPFIDTSKMNEGGFYKGMPGVHLDDWGNRKFIQFCVTPEGKATAQLFAHSQHIKRCIEQSMTNPMLKGVVYSAVVDHMFRNKTIWNWPLRTRYKLMRYWESRKADKESRRQMAKAFDHAPIPEQHGNTQEENRQATQR